MRWPAVLLAGLPAGCDAAPAAGVVDPPAGASFDHQLGGAYPPEDSAGIVVRDRTARPDPGRYSICYLNAFRTQPGERGLPEHLLLRDSDGRPVADPDRSGEFLVDVSTADERQALLAVVVLWIERCADDGYDGVEPDNLDSWTRSGGALTEDDAAATARLLVGRAHDAGLAIAQKNAVELADDDLGFDFAVTEDCAAYGECAAYAAAYDVVLDVEYDGPCPDGDLPDGVSVLRRDLELTPQSSPEHVGEDCTG